VIIAAEWYTSGTFWAGAGVVAAVLVGVATVAVTYMAAFPRRRLLYGIATVAPLLSAPDGVRGDLELRHRGRPLTDPHVLEVVLAGQGRRDIPSDAFDGGTPIRLDAGAPIVELLRVVSESSSNPAPATRVDGTALEIGPGLIGRRQKLTFTFLVEGEPGLDCQAPLIDVDSRRYNPGDLPGPRRVLGWVPLLLAGGVLYVTGRFDPLPEPWATVVLAVVGVVTVALLEPTTRILERR
jgi:hypothetical protein